MKMKYFCSDLKYVTAISMIAAAIGSNFDNPDELALAAAVIAQVGDTMSTLTAKRALCDAPPTNGK